MKTGALEVRRPRSTDHIQQTADMTVRDQRSLWFQRHHLGEASENGPDRTLGLAQRSELAPAESRGVPPLVVPGKVDVLPAERRQVFPERRVYRIPVFA